MALIFVKDLDRMVTFYRDGMGLPLLVRQGDRWAELDAGGTSLALHAVPPDLAARITLTDPPSPRSDTPLKLIFETDDLAAAQARLQAAGAVPLKLHEDGSCDALDPEGNVFRITHAE